MRTYAQFENKIVKGGRAYARNRELPDRTGRTWRRLYERWEAGRASRLLRRAGGRGMTASDDLLEDTRLRDYLAGLEARAGARES